MRYFFNGEGPVGRVQNMKGERERKNRPNLRQEVDRRPFTNWANYFLAEDMIFISNKVHNNITSTPVDIKFCEDISPQVSQASSV